MNYLLRICNNHSRNIINLPTDEFSYRLPDAVGAGIPRKHSHKGHRQKSNSVLKEQKVRSGGWKV